MGKAVLSAILAGSLLGAVAVFAVPTLKHQKSDPNVPFVRYVECNERNYFNECVELKMTVVNPLFTTIDANITCEGNQGQVETIYPRTATEVFVRVLVPPAVCKLASYTTP